MQTWEKVENLFNIKDMLRVFNESLQEQEQKTRLGQRKMEAMRRRSRKAQTKGSFEKMNKIDAVMGLRRNKYDN